jgi:hypothetical protein
VARHSASPMDWLSQLQRLCTPQSTAVMRSEAEEPRPGQDQTRPASPTARNRSEQRPGEDSNWISLCCTPHHSTPIMKDESEGGVKRAGIGIVLSQHPDQSIFVHTVCKGEGISECEQRTKLTHPHPRPDSIAMQVCSL